MLCLLFAVCVARGDGLIARCAVLHRQRQPLASKRMVRINGTKRIHRFISGNCQR